MERYSVDISKQAWADMQGILHYIATYLREPAAAERTLDRFEETALSLETMPLRFALVPDSCLASVGLRMTSVGNYLVFYTVNENDHVVHISRVLYGRQNWTELLTCHNDKPAPAEETAGAFACYLRISSCLYSAIFSAAFSQEKLSRTNS